ncbi:MAG: SRPBCC family protein [Pseudonocardiaceae bacterium]
MTRLRSETQIDAPAERVWAVLADFASWSRWNPTLISAEGTATVGARVRLRLRLGRHLITLHRTILEVDPPCRLRWRSSPGIPRLVDVERVFDLESLGPSRVRLVQSERGRGILAPVLLWLLATPIMQGYQNLGRALGEQVEQSHV